VYWTDDFAGTVTRVPIGGGPQTEIARGAAPRRIVVDAVNVYWIDGQEIMKAPKVGGAATELASTFVPKFIAVDETHVYWTDSTDTVSKVSLAGGEPTPIASGQKSPCGIVVDANSVYWTNTGNDGGYLDGEVMKVAK